MQYFFLALMANLHLAGNSISTATDEMKPDLDVRREMIRTLQSDYPDPAIGEAAKLFDRFVGTWSFETTLTDPDGTVTRMPGRWSFGWVLDGRAMQDVITFYPGGLEKGAAGERYSGSTMRMFDSKTREWRVIWMVPVSAKVLTLRGGAEGDRIVLRGTDLDGSAMRWSFNDIKPDSLLWLGETSKDGGRSWRVEQVMRLKRISPHPDLP